VEENSSQERGHCQTCVTLMALLSLEEPLSAAQRGRGRCTLRMGPGRGPTGGTSLPSAESMIGDSNKQT